MRRIISLILFLTISFVSFGDISVWDLYPVDPPAPLQAQEEFDYDKSTKVATMILLWTGVVLGVVVLVGVTAYVVSLFIY